ncbi:hypothetical protein BOW53_14960 [Solemya pervernicosa gill symbiont]|uniref:Chaperone NapD n=2 Tax=Gammaproteobacteria incertae sedis TaxID=118884 RepID=A0A1T2L0F7_9GAMM|nr:chaperone NapD [Candidatus Reidiella endopervernicosa]OOZ38597.1 hypothetical protein BOW53_14960 [Solemya pervernicosa gill symbiont]QKQ24948.1 chaperone NapD [Candidatus Reidiella endopervernicosa]
MNICGVLVHARPENIVPVKERLQHLEGVEVHAINDDGQLVVTLEQDDEGLMADTLMSFQNVDGVISASMIYHHNEDENNEEVEHLEEVVQ